MQLVQAATPGCTKQACAFRDAFGKFKDIGAEVFGISSDDVQKNSEFAKVRLARMAQESWKALQTPFWRKRCGNKVHWQDMPLINFLVCRLSGCHSRCLQTRVSSSESPLALRATYWGKHWPQCLSLCKILACKHEGHEYDYCGFCANC